MSEKERKESGKIGGSKDSNTVIKRISRQKRSQKRKIAPPKAVKRAAVAAPAGRSWKEESESPASAPAEKAEI